MGVSFLLGGCGESDGISPVHEPPGDRFELRLKGADLEAYDKVMLGIGSVEVTAGGQPVPVSLSPAGRFMDLSIQDHAHLLGSFYLPKDAPEANIRVRFDDVGLYHQGTEGGLINARSATILFTSQRVELEKRKHAVIELHLKQSLDQGAGEKVLLPTTFIAH
ncbi:hypothetical protein DRW03_16175 [Corallococcus sp. H22C18031201]|nr:hypothetical protein [Citreicoccus inhibens]RJS22015.1 hypothetical protein DRW03_16175 [Corallococcus sp. H22C18031201]